MKTFLGWKRPSIPQADADNYFAGADPMKRMFIIAALCCAVSMVQVKQSYGAGVIEEATKKSKARNAERKRENDRKKAERENRTSGKKAGDSQIVDNGKDLETQKLYRQLLLWNRQYTNFIKLSEKPVELKVDAKEPVKTGELKESAELNVGIDESLSGEGLLVDSDKDFDGEALIVGESEGDFEVDLFDEDLDEDSLAEDSDAEEKEFQKLQAEWDELEKRLQKAPNPTLKTKTDTGIKISKGEMEELKRNPSKMRSKLSQIAGDAIRYAERRNLITGAAALYSVSSGRINFTVKKDFLLMDETAQNLLLNFVSGHYTISYEYVTPEEKRKYTILDAKKWKPLNIQIWSKGRTTNIGYYDPVRKLKLNPSAVREVMQINE